MNSRKRASAVWSKLLSLDLVDDWASTGEQTLAEIATALESAVQEARREAYRQGLEDAALRCESHDLCTPELEAVAEAIRGLSKGRSK